MMSLVANSWGSGSQPGRPSSRVLVCTTVAPMAPTTAATRLAILP